MTSSKILPQLIATCGLPRSGKTTWITSIRDPHGGPPIVSPDAIRLALHGQAFLSTAEPIVWGVAPLMVASLFQAGHRLVVVDATNITRRRRDMWRDPRWVVAFHHVDTPAEECLRRARAEGNENLAKVIEKMAKEWEPLAADELRWD